MSSKKTIDHYCNNCGADFMITYDEENSSDDPYYCTFCGVEFDFEFADEGGEGGELDDQLQFVRGYE